MYKSHHARKIGQQRKKAYIAAYMKAQQANNQFFRIGAASILQRSPGVTKPPEVIRFGAWRLPQRTKHQIWRARSTQSQVEQSAIDRIPDPTYLGSVPHVWEILKSNATHGGASDSCEKPAQMPSELEGVRTARAISETVIPTYASPVHLELLRTQKSWLRALDICVHHLWVNLARVEKEETPASRNYRSDGTGKALIQWRNTSRVRNIRNESKNKQDQLAVVVSLCPKDCKKSPWICYRIARHCQVRPRMDTLLSLLARNGDDGNWKTAMKLMTDSLQGHDTKEHGTTDRIYNTAFLHDLESQFALLINIVGTRKQVIHKILDHVETYFPQLRSSPAIWAAYMKSKVCGWRECIDLYLHNFPKYHVSSDTRLFNTLLQRCTSAGALGVARSVLEIMATKGIPQSTTNMPE